MWRCVRMSFNILYDKANDGVFPGGLHSKEQIKILICYLIYETKVPVGIEFMSGILQECGVANYFEASAGFSELIANGQLVICEGDEVQYQLSHSGKFIVNNLSDELPVTVKEETLEKYQHFLHQRDIQQDNTVTLTKKNNKTYVECTMNDGDTQLLKISMYSPNNEQAGFIRNVFYNNTDVIYQAVVALMTGDKKSALNIISVADFKTDGAI